MSNLKSKKQNMIKKCVNKIALNLLFCFSYTILAASEPDPILPSESVHHVAAVSATPMLPKLTPQRFFEGLEIMETRACRRHTSNHRPKRLCRKPCKKFYSSSSFISKWGNKTRC